MFDHYEDDAYLSHTVCIEVFDNLEDAQKREKELAEGFEKFFDQIRLKDKIDFWVHIDRSLNMETNCVEYRIKVTAVLKEIRRAVAR